MITFYYDTIGVMSGTSLDGVDLVYNVLEKKEAWNFKILHAETISYPPKWKQQLREAHRYDAKKLKVLDQKYTQFLAGVILDFIERNTIQNVDAVCSHGHTILHQPDSGVTLQIGNQKELASLIGQKVICDFRVQDVQLGGQGAPLVPIGDQLLFSQYAYCVNLGGFANVSMQRDEQRIAYDICPVNIVLNKLVSVLGYDYDDGGAMANSGALIPELLTALQTLEFYHQEPPKSLGLEWVECFVMPLLEEFHSYGVPALLHTFCVHGAKQIAAQFTTEGTPKVLFTGGGVYNDFLMKEIAKYTSATVIIPDPMVVEFKEALIFSFLGVLRLRGESNCLRSVTGADKDHSSGNIFEP